MPKKEKKRLQVVITEEQDSLLTETAYGLSSKDRLFSKSEVVRLAIENLAQALRTGEVDLEGLVSSLEDEEEAD
jgi:uncharacterized membrane protein YgaE (UPF0421/DUF939 family)